MHITKCIAEQTEGIRIRMEWGLPLMSTITGRQIIVISTGATLTFCTIVAYTVYSVLSVRRVFIESCYRFVLSQSFFMVHFNMKHSLQHESCFI